MLLSSDEVKPYDAAKWDLGQLNQFGLKSVKMFIDAFEHAYAVEMNPAFHPSGEVKGGSGGGEL